MRFRARGLAHAFGAHGVLCDDVGAVEQLGRLGDILLAHLIGRQDAIGNDDANPGSFLSVFIDSHCWRRIRQYRALRFILKRDRYISTILRMLVSHNNLEMIFLRRFVVILNIANGRDFTRTWIDIELIGIFTFK